ncbi:hypothetical protein [Clostridium sp.]|uniref:hypothetical protein n=1 Tax=Clostridium sp. TaxID=1506 RepID=UPI001A395C55|nr:hypothetical protein [Clostridium sp.]MBK5242607.1 hypothetical protein [Clostridium sp.]
MRKKNKQKYYVAIIFCISIFIYGLIIISIRKPELLRKKSPFTVDVSLKPIDIKIETKDYIIYVNNKVIDGVKEKCNDIYNNIFSK